MKAHHLLLTAATLALTTATAFSQGGPLTPPAGAPAPTMKTLDQIEPRTPLVAGAPGVSVTASGQITISQSGSYYLTGNLDIKSNARGIQVNAAGVTVDLMGYAIRYTGEGNAGNAILISVSNVTIQNGHILSTTTHDGSAFTLGGFESGISVFDPQFRGRNNITVRNISMEGVRTVGIDLPGRCLVENCTVRIAGTQGIRNINGIVKNCIVQTSGSTGITAHSVLDCRVDGAVATGINAHIVANSSAISTNQTGISATRSVIGSFGQSNSTNILNSHGINCFYGVVTSSSGIASRGMGIYGGTVTSSKGIGDHAGIDGFTVSNSIGLSSVGPGISARQSVTGSYGRSDSTNIEVSHGINCPNGTVTASYGEASQGLGIWGITVISSRGESSGSSGIRATTVTNSFGWAKASGGGHGIVATSSVTGSYGQSDSTSSSSCGIYSSNGTVTSSRGSAAGGQGIYAEIGSVSQSYGESSGTISSARGIEAQIVSDSRGHSTNVGGGEGLRANTHAMNSSGQSAGASGLFANRAATNCYGYTNFTSTAAHGISSNGTVNGSYGWSNGSGGGDGINASVVAASYGQAGAGARHGINARIVDSSRGHRLSSVTGKFGITANRASISESVNGENITHKYNMP